MRIRKLKIENFLSIRKTTIDFSAFHDGVFIISGPTGSGKSAILDAIHFVLFGTPCNHNRAISRKTLHSTFAGKGEPLKVWMEFEQDGIVYEVYRDMNYTGMSTGWFMKEGEGKISGIKEINPAIEKVLMLNSQQFDQMVMLEQGNFSKFLLASSSERGDLLRDIFDTEIFQKIAEYFKTKASESKARLDEILTEERLLLNGFTVENLKEEYAAEKVALENLKKLQIELGDRLAGHRKDLEVRKDYDKALSTWTSAQEELKRLDETQDEYNRIVHLRNVYDQLNRVKFLLNNIDDTNIKISNCESGIQALEKKLAELPKVPETSYAEVISIKHARLNELASMNKDIQEHARLSELLAGYQTRLNQVEQESRKVDTDKTQADINLLREQIRERSSFDSDIQSYNRRVSDLEKAKENLEKYSKIAEAERIKLHDNSVAYLLSEGNDTCPICGNPLTQCNDIAKLTDCDWGALGRAEERVRGLTESISNLEEATQTKPTTDLDSLEILNSKLELANRLHSSSCTRAHALEQEGISLQYQISECNSAISRLTPIVQLPTVESILEEADKIKSELQNLESEESIRTQILSERSSAEGKLEVARADLVILKRNLGELKMSPDMALVPKYQENVSLIQDYEKNQAYYNSYISGIDARRKMYSAIVKPECTITRTGLELEWLIQGEDDELRGVIERKAVLEKTQKDLENAISKIDDVVARREAEATIFREYDYMAKQTSGNNDSKISLENFVLHRQLEWILQNSNHFLAQMTNNQYQLQLSWEGMTNRKQAGLELSVLDTNTNTIRPSQTFSGGELFLLSLSLSIGLMISINAVFTTVNLETLFIDEGFGTLDAATLNRCLSLITSLQTVNTIGIISHVQDLIEMVPQGLHVNKTLDGTIIKQFGV